MAGKSASDFDVRLGARLREARIASDMSQSEIGKLIGVSFQQVQRYERGVNRLPGSAFAILHARIGLAAEDEEEEGAAPRQGRARPPGAAELLGLYDRLDTAARRALIKVAKDFLARSVEDQSSSPPS